MAAGPDHDASAVAPLAGALGAEIGGVDLTRIADDRGWDPIHRAFLAWQVLVFRGQRLSLADLMTVARRFGEPTHYPFVAAIEGYPHIVEIVKEPHETANFGGAWHADTTYQARPPLATLLYARETPTHGGDTLFASQYLAYETLSEGMRTMLAPLRAINSASLERVGGRLAAQSGHAGMKTQGTADAASHEGVHPVVRTHPETGRKALYVSRTHTIRFAGMTGAESRPLIDFLADHAVRPEFTCRVRWEPGTLVVWDNRCTQHFAINDYTGQRRVMQRVTVGPQVPM